MTNQPIKRILLESLKTAEKTLEKDLKQDEKSKSVLRYLLHFFKYIGIDSIEKLAAQSKDYIKGQIQIGIDISITKVASAVSSTINLITKFFIVSIGLVFGAISLSLFLGELVGSNALGFLISGALWVIIMLTTLKVIFNKKKLENLISKKIKISHQ